MRLNSLWFLVGITLAFIAIAGFIGASQEDVVGEIKQEEPRTNGSRATFRVSKILDFELYKKLFKKGYKSGVEEVVRRKYFIARALRAWTSSIKYRWRKSNFYLSINHLSDRSIKELKRRLNRHAQLNQSQLKIVLVVDDIDADSVEPKDRSKTDVTVESDKLRDFDQQKLLATGEGVKLNPETIEKIEAHPESHKAEYHTDKPVISEGAANSKLKYISIRAGDMEEVPEKLKKSQVSFFAGRNDPSKPDEVFFDHRQSNCLFLPRNQGDCGSCYAFASISIAEWLHCKRTGKLVAFSEQYMVDCGSRVHNNGCDGGNGYSSGMFIHNYGLELRSDYPYRYEKGKCPYNRKMDPQSMGYLRMGLEVGMLVPLRLVEHFIQYGPMFIAVSTKNGLTEYGGGVIGGAGCESVPEHAVVLIGHGREDGVEYWLIRNSDGPNWGEAGHFKLAKQSDCIHDRFAAFYGTYDGKEFNHSLEENPLYDPSILKKLQEDFN